MSSGRPNLERQGALSSAHRDGLLLVICTITFAVYRVVMGHSFLAYDDPFFVTDNPYVRQGLTAEGMAWAATATLGFYHPITWLSLMLDATLFGVQPSAFHLTNLWLHIANVVLVFHFLHRATGAAAQSLVVADLFAWHPINVEAVAWVSERKGLLATMFALLALVAYVRHTERPSRSRMAVVALTMLLSLLCKGTAVILPALCLVLDYWPFQRLSQRAAGGPHLAAGPRWRAMMPLILEKTPLFLLSAVFVLLTFWAESNVGAVRSLEQFSVGDRALNVVSVIPLYLRQLLLPTGLTVYYPERIGTPAEVLLLIFVTVLVGWLVVRCWSTRKPVAAGILWWLACLAPVLGVIKIGTHAMADRYMYLAQVGLFVALVWTLGGWPWLTGGRRILLLAGTAAVLLLNTHRQLSHWKDDLALASNGERVTGKNAVVCFGLGIEYERLGEREKSLQHFREVLDHHFDYHGTHYNIARAYVLKGCPKRALVHLDLALRQSPYEPKCHNLLAEVLCASPDAAMRDGARAVEHALWACRLSRTQNASYLDTLAAALAETGEFARAVAAATRALQLADTPGVQDSIRRRIQLYAAGKPYRGILLHDALIGGPEGR